MDGELSLIDVQTWTLVWDITTTPVHEKDALREKLFRVVLDTKAWETIPKDRSIPYHAFKGVPFEDEFSEDAILKHLVEKCQVSPSFVQSQFRPYVQ